MGKGMPGSFGNIEDLIGGLEDCPNEQFSVIEQQLESFFKYYFAGDFIYCRKRLADGLQKVDTSFIQNFSPSLQDDSFLEYLSKSFDIGKEFLGCYLKKVAEKDSDYNKKIRSICWDIRAAEDEIDSPYNFDNRNDAISRCIKLEEERDKLYDEQENSRRTVDELKYEYENSLKQAKKSRLKKSPSEASL